MRYYPKLKIFRNSTGTNKFDGIKATSYDWYVYAYKLSDNEFVVTEEYSPTTGKHRNAFYRLCDNTCKHHYVQAPRGLQDLAAAKRAITAEIKTLQNELKNPRIRNITRREERIATLNEQFKIIAKLEQRQKQEKSHG